MSVANGFNDALRLFEQRKANRRANENERARLAFAETQEANRLAQQENSNALQQVRLGQEQARLDIASAAADANRETQELQRNRLKAEDEKQRIAEVEERRENGVIEATRALQAEAKVQGWLNPNGLSFSSKFYDAVEQQDPKALDYVRTFVDSSGVIKNGAVSGIRRIEDGTFVVDIKNSDGTPGVLTTDGSSEPDSSVVRLTPERMAGLADTEFRGLIAKTTDVNNLVDQNALIDAKLNSTISQIIGATPGAQERDVRVFIGELMKLPVNERGPALEELLVDVEGLSGTPEVAQDPQEPVQDTQAQDVPVQGTPRPKAFNRLDALEAGTMFPRATEERKAELITQERNKLTNELTDMREQLAKDEQRAARTGNARVNSNRREQLAADIVAFENALNPQPAAKPIEQAIQDADAPAIVDAIETGAFTPSTEEAEAVKRELNEKGVKALKDIANAFSAADQMRIYAVMAASLPPGAQRQAITAQLNNVGDTGSPTYSQKDRIDDAQTAKAGAQAAADKALEVGNAIFKEMSEFTNNDPSKTPIDTLNTFGARALNMAQSPDRSQSDQGYKLLGSMFAGATSYIADNNPDAGLVNRFVSMFGDDASDSSVSTDFKLRRVFPVMTDGKITAFRLRDAAGNFVGTRVDATTIEDKLGGVAVEALRYAADRNQEREDKGT